MPDGTFISAVSFFILSLLKLNNDFITKINNCNILLTQTNKKHAKINL